MDHFFQSYSSFVQYYTYACTWKTCCLCRLFFVFALSRLLIVLLQGHWVRSEKCYRISPTAKMQENTEREVRKGHTHASRSNHFHLELQVSTR